MKIAGENGIPTVSLIVVNYNGKRHLKDCLGSLSGLRYPRDRLEISVVDNGSTDGSLEYIQQHFSRVKVFKNEVNNYCRANNLGIQRSSGAYVGFLNNDTSVDRYWLRELMAPMASDRRIGCCSGKILFPDGRIQSTGHYEFPNFYWGDRGLREPDIGQYDLPEEVNSFSGSAVLFRRECLDDVGYFDEDFVMFLEDVDIFLRCRKKGWKLLYVPSGIVHHKFHGTADENLVRYYIERNRLLLLAKHYPDCLARALQERQHSLNQDEIFKILPDIFLKLVKNHQPNTINEVAKEFFPSLQHLYNFSKDAAVQKLTSMLNEAQVMKENALKEAGALRDNTQREKAILTETLKSQLSEKEALFEQMKQTKAALDALLIQKNEENQALSSQLDEAKRKSEQLQAESSRLQASLNELQQQREQLTTEISRLTTEANARNEDFGNLQRTLADTNQQLVASQAESSRLQASLNELQQQREQLTTEISRLTTEANARNEDKEKLLEKVKSLELDAQRIFFEKEIEKRDLKFESDLRIKELQTNLANKDSLIKELNAACNIRIQEIELISQQNLRQEKRLQDLTQQLQEKSQEAQLFLANRTELGRQINSLQQEAQERLNIITTQTHIIDERQKQLSQKEQEINDKVRMIQDKDAQINAIFNSRTYRYLAYPLWKSLDAVKKIFSIKPKRILIIKPYYVSADETKAALDDLQKRFIGQKITLFANLLPQEYDSLLHHEAPCEKILFSASSVKLTPFRFLWVVFLLNSRFYDKNILLIGRPVYHGYRKAKLFADTIGGREVMLYYVTTKTIAPLWSLDTVGKIKSVMRLTLNAAVFWGILLFFIVCIVLPLKLKKIFRR